MAGSEGGLPERRERFFSQTPGRTSGVTLRPKEKFALIRKLSMDVGKLSVIADVSRSGYYKWLRHAGEPEKDWADYLLIKAVFDRGRGKYGWRTTQMKLAAKGTVMNHKKIQRIKIKYRLFTKIRRANPYKAILRKTKEHRIFENKLERKFQQNEPQKTYCTDITFLPFNRRFAYLSAVKDVATREIVAWNTSMHPQMDLVLGTLERMRSAAGGLLHSDQGFHYTNPQYIQCVERLGLVQSMSRKGNCLDNAPMESFFGHFKDEVNFAGCKTFDELKTTITKYMQYYNTERQQWNLKKMTPVEYRNHLLSAA
jgi:putative transposase